MPDYSLNWTARSKVSVMQLARPKVAQPNPGAFRSRVCHGALTVRHGCQAVRWKTSARSRDILELSMLKKHDVFYSSKISEVTWYELLYNNMPNQPIHQFCANIGYSPEDPPRMMNDRDGLREGERDFRELHTINTINDDNDKLILSSVLYQRNNIR